MSPSPLKILFIVHNVTLRGGAYYRAQGLAKPLAKLGHQVTILAISPKNRFCWESQQIDGVTVLGSPDLLWGVGRSGFDPWNTLRRSLKLIGGDYDIVHTIDTRPAVSIPAWLLQKTSRTRWVADWTDWWGKGGAAYERNLGFSSLLLAKFEEFFEEKPRPLADATVVISRALEKRARELPVKPGHILYLPPGANSEALSTTSVAEARSRVLPDYAGPLIGYMGNIYQRDADLLFGALEKLPGVRLVMIGKAKYTIPASVEDRVVKTGFLEFPAMLDYLCACDCLTLPLTDSVANRGRWPSKLNEYVAVGRATVACGVGDITELFTKYGIGLVCTPEPEDMAAKLSRLLADAPLRERMGQAAREFAQGEYSQLAVAQRLEAFYRDVLAA
jgi:glycosyltransferase involved in cell wall biosynthesis